MNKKISGEELLLAIGELPEELLDCKSASLSRAIIFKKLTFAATFVITVALSLQIAFFGIFSAKGTAPDMNGSFGEMSGGNSQAPSGSFGDTSKNDSANNESSAETNNVIIIDSDGKIKNTTNYENNCLLLKRYNSNIIEFNFEFDSSKPYKTELTTIKNDSETIIGEEGLLGEKYKIYRIEIEENSRIIFKNNQSTEDFEIKITVYDDYYECTISSALE